MPVAVYAGIATAVVAAAVVYSRKKRADHADDARVVERLDSIAVKDAILTPDQRLFFMPDKTVRRS